MYNDCIFQDDWQKGYIYKAEIERIKKDLRKTKSVPELIKKLQEIDENYKEMNFNLREASGSGNYKDPELWTVLERHDFINRKNAQINKAKSGRGIKNKHSR